MFLPYLSVALTLILTYFTLVLSGFKILAIFKCIRFPELKATKFVTSTLAGSPVILPATKIQFISSFVAG